MPSLLRAAVPALLAAGLLAGCAAQTAPASPAASSHTGGSSRDLQREEANRKLVLTFYDEFFTRHEVEKASRVIADDYIQHNPDVPDGKAPFVDYFTGFFHDDPESVSTVVRSGTAGDLVFVHAHEVDHPGDLGFAVMDIFRVERGRIVEHWDVVQPVPEPSANDNTMF
jgi:predicted SnoaL-like aldol condensation-catalyzing enzyme